MIDMPPTMPPAIIKSLAGCGLNPNGITAAYDDELQSEVVTIGIKARARPDMFECIRAASWGKFDVSFSDEKLSKSYRVHDEARIQITTQAVSWLKAHGKLKNLPVFQPTDDASKFAKKVEIFCGIKPGEAIELISPRMLTFRRQFLNFSVNPKLECLMNVLFASDLKARGISMGFVGNEAFRDAPPDKR